MDRAFARLARSASLGLLVVLLLIPAGAPAAPLTRRLDPVVLAGADLLVLPKPATAHLRLYRWRDGAFEAIPYQFDARDKNGDVELATQDFALDANDELAFMAADTGARADPSALPPDMHGGRGDRG